MVLRALLRSVVVRETAGLWDFSLPAGQLLGRRRSAGVNRVWGSPARHDRDMQRSCCARLHKTVFEGHSQSPWAASVQERKQKVKPWRDQHTRRPDESEELLKQGRRERRWSGSRMPRALVTEIPTEKLMPSSLGCQCRGVPMRRSWSQ